MKGGVGGGVGETTNLNHTKHAKDIDSVAGRAILKPILFYLLIILFDGSGDINFPYCFVLLGELGENRRLTHKILKYYCEIFSDYETKKKLDERRKKEFYFIIPFLGVHCSLEYHLRTIPKKKFGYSQVANSCPVGLPKKVEFTSTFFRPTRLFFWISSKISKIIKNIHFRY